MALLPDIVREAKIVSGKDKELNVKQHLFAMATGLTSTSHYYETNKTSSDNINKRNEMSKVLIKRNNSLSASHDRSIFPHLITNDGHRSTAYQRVIRSSDFSNVKSSPLATRLIYNWTPLERKTTLEVEAQAKMFKPPKRIEMPGRPVSPYKVTADYESGEPHLHNEKRALDMKRMQYQREHTTWSVYPYAAIQEREYYK